MEGWAVLAAPAQEGPELSLAEVLTSKVAWLAPAQVEVVLSLFELDDLYAFFKGQPPQVASPMRAARYSNAAMTVHALPPTTPQADMSDPAAPVHRSSPRTRATSSACSARATASRQARRIAPPSSSRSGLRDHTQTGTGAGTQRRVLAVAGRPSVRERAPGGWADGEGGMADWPHVIQVLDGRLAACDTRVGWPTGRT